jgi:hypothetical protein
MLRPVIMIGCGGSGQKAVRYVRDAVRRRLFHAGWDGDFPKAWQFIGIDTLTIQEDPSIPFLPSTDYLSVSLQYETFKALDDALGAKFPKNSAGFREMMGWRPNPNQVMVPLSAGAGQLRAVGRAAGVLALQKDVQQRIIKAFSECAAGGPQLGEVSQRLGVNVPPGTPTPSPITLIVGSLAGGTGAGIMLDVVDLVRRTHLDGQFPVLVGFTPDIFGGVQTDMMAANSAAFMAELMSAYWDNENADDALVPAAVNVHTRGPHSVFIVGRKNMDGLDLIDSKNVYRAVGEALAAVTTSAKVQTDFHHFVTVNWAAAAPANQGGYGFHNERMKGVASSFGSTTLSIGRDRFRDYLQKLLHRSIVEFLASGFEEAAVAELGESAAKSLAGEAKIAELARRHRDEFISACGLQERASANQVSDIFVSNDLMKAEYQQILNQIKSGFPAGVQQSPAAWSQIINAQVQQASAASTRRADSETLVRRTDWGSSVYQQVLNAITDFSARLSIPVVLNLIELARAEVLEVSSEMRLEASKARSAAEQMREKSRTHLSSDTRGNIASTAGPVQETINDVSRTIAWEWTARVRDQVAVALEAVGSGMLNSIEAGLRQALGNINQLVLPQDGKAPVISSWPINDGSVPASFAPSPVEFYLESYSGWPDRAKELLERSLGEGREFLPVEPLHAARTLIIRGGYDRGKNELVPPLVWADSRGGVSPRWSVGEPASVLVDDSLEKIETRIDSWLSRPSTEISNFLNEGLRQYLQVRHERTGVPISDHAQRLSSYRQRLQEALNQSRPLVELDQNMYATVHSQDMVTKLNVQGFPFGEGHPAREITKDVIQGFMKTADDVDWIFTSSEAESVLISSFLEYPVHPSVITSFTQPFAAAIGRVGDEAKLRSSFWLWRRSRILENFIPLPDDLRVAAIRGFAVARSLGYMTSDPDITNQIVGDDGIHSFPRWLLTATNQANMLPAILESMILTFADAPTKGRSAFDAYRTMIDLGYGGQTQTEFIVRGDLKSYLVDGRLLRSPLDTRRAESLNSALTIEDRCAVILKYLEPNLKRFEQLSEKPLENTHWRNDVGSVDPVDTISLEILKDLIRGYSDVRDAVAQVADETAVIS